MERGIPENKKIRELLAPKFSERDKKMIGMMEYVSTIKPSWYDAGPKGASEVNTLFQQMVQKQQFGKASIDSVVADFRKEANKIFEKNK
jgi:multiple sugar transport system substrate-binding protein